MKAPLFQAADLIEGGTLSFVWNEKINAKPTSGAITSAQLSGQGARFHGQLILLIDCAHREASYSRILAWRTLRP